ncbi:hypothetical protein A2U01_0101616, partial [Trifolium medium]|nr:hypothetical protein [Trifolium medium]
MERMRNWNRFLLNQCKILHNFPCSRAAPAVLRDAQ